MSTYLNFRIVQTGNSYGLKTLVMDDVKQKKMGRTLKVTVRDNIDDFIGEIASEDFNIEEGISEAFFTINVRMLVYDLDKLRKAFDSGKHYVSFAASGTMVNGSFVSGLLDSISFNDYAKGYFKVDLVSGALRDAALLASASKITESNDAQEHVVEEQIEDV